MIVFIDEDMSQISAQMLELELRGFDVQQLEDADRALERLPEMQDIQLLIVDVMLAAHWDAERSAFSDKETSGYFFTGLSLAQRLIDDGVVLPHSIVFYSMISSYEAQERVRAFCKKTGATYLMKSQFQDPYEFVDRIVTMISEAKRV
jgi:CheY-like chemotaxis protein